MTWVFFVKKSGSRRLANDAIKQLLMPRCNMGEGRWQAIIRKIVRAMPSGQLLSANTSMMSGLLKSTSKQAYFCVAYMVGTLVALDCNTFSEFCATESRSKKEYVSICAFTDAVSIFLSCDELLWTIIPAEGKRSIDEECEKLDKADEFDLSIFDDEVKEAYLRSMAECERMFIG